MSKVKEYINETVVEMTQRVTWPTWKELQSNTIVVVVASVILSLLIFAMDFGFGIAGKEDAVALSGQLPRLGVRLSVSCALPRRAARRGQGGHEYDLETGRGLEGPDLQGVRRQRHFTAVRRL